MRLVRRALLVLLAALAFGYLATASAVAASPAPTAPSPTGSPSAAPAASAVPGGLTSVVSGDAESALATWVAQSAVSSAQALMSQFGSSASDPELGSAVFSHLYFGGDGDLGALTVAMWLAVPVLLGAVLRHLLAGDAAGMIHTVLVRLPAAAAVSFAAIVWVEALLSLTDWVTSALMGSNGDVALSAWANSLAGTGGQSDFASMVVCLLITVAALACAIELVVRAAALYLLVAFVPLLAIASLWPGARGALRRLAEVITITCLAKLIIGFALVLGASLLASSVTAGAPLLTMIQSAVLLLGAALMPIGMLSGIRLFESGAGAVVAGIGTMRALRVAGSLPGRIAGSPHGGPHEPSEPLIPAGLQVTPAQSHDLKLVGRRPLPARGAENG